MIARRLLAVFLVLGAGLLALVALTLPAGAEDPTDDGGEAALAAHELQWTRYPVGGTERIRAGFGNAIWGGGSFLKLIGKLVIEGCDVNAIAVYDAEDEELLLSHHFQAQNFVNADFGKGGYLREVPAGSVLAFTCVDACDIFIGPGAAEAKGIIEPCMSAEERMREFGHYELFVITSDCRETDFPIDVTKQFVAFAPMDQDVCKVDYSRGRSKTRNSGMAAPSGELHYTMSFYYKRNAPFIMIADDNLPLAYDGGSNRDYFLYSTLVLHELCHQQQFWYLRKFYFTYEAAEAKRQVYWEDTLAGKAFVNMIGYKSVGESKWGLDSNSRYYMPRTSGHPFELAANICSFYFVDKIYDNEYPEVEGRLTASRFLNDETRAWVERYIAVE